MNPVAHIQSVGPDYAPILAALQAACFEEAWPTPDIAALLHDVGGDAILLQAADESAFGFAVFRTVLDEAELLAIGVLPPARERGFGRALLECVLARARAAGASRLFLEVAADNAPALALYRTAGFTPIGVRKLYYKRPGGAGTDAQVLCRDTDPLPPLGPGA